MSSMKIAFLYRVHENLGIEYLSGMLRKAGHRTRLFFDPALFDDGFLPSRRLSGFFDYSERIIKDVLDYRPGLVCFSVLTFDFLWACGLSRRIRERTDVPIVFGGMHPTFVPEEVLRNGDLDFVIRGEGEHALLDLVSALGQGNSPFGIENLCSRTNGDIVKNPLRPLVRNLDELPFPDKDLYVDQDQCFREGYLLITGRGCPYNCSFCSNGALRSQYPGQRHVRRRSVDNVMAELLMAKERYGIRQVAIHDNDFCYQESWLEEFSGKYKDRINVPFYCLARPGSINDRVAKYLKSSGCIEVEIGVETLNEDIKERVLNRRESEEEVVRAIRTLKRHGLKCITDSLIGIPEQTEKDLTDLARFYVRERPGKTFLFSVSYLPKTRLVDIAREKGILNEQDVERINRGLAGYSFYLGKEKSEEKFLILFFLISVLPRWASDFIISRRVYSLFAVPFFPFVYFLLQVLYLSPLKRIDLYMKRSRNRYVRYLMNRLGFDFSGARKGSLNTARETSS